ncbi:MAG TPA: hypothetical protein VGP93_16555 [Polyangiaceae bacterium]|nr:hypothetical protein [Polyangiaceae bacterium]
MRTCRLIHTLTRLADLLPSLPGCLTDLPCGPAGCLSGTARHLPRRLAELLTEPADALSDPAECLARATGKLSSCTAGAKRLPSRIGQPAKRLACRAPGLDSLFRRLSDVIQRLADGTTRTKCRLSYVPDAAHRVIDGFDQALENLRIAIESGQRTIEDVVEILEPHLELCLRLDTRDVHLDLAEVDVHACDHLEQVGQLRAQRQMSLELLDVDVDLVDLDLSMLT